MRIVVVGAGAIGSAVAAILAATGRDVVLIARAPCRYSACARLRRSVSARGYNLSATGHRSGADIGARGLDGAVLRLAAQHRIPHPTFLMLDKMIRQRVPR